MKDAIKFLKGYCHLRNYLLLILVLLFAIITNDYAKMFLFTLFGIVARMIIDLKKDENEK